MLNAWIVTAITDEHILPDAKPPLVPDGFVIKTAKGETCSASLCVRSDRPLALTAEPTMKQWTGDVLPSIELHHVARWWQDGKLVPELLVNDPGFVEPDDKGNNEFLTDHEDTDEIQPVYLPADHTRQYWVTINVPVECTAGDFTLAIDLKNGSEIMDQVTYMIQVLPFVLPPSPMQHLFFYRAHLDTSLPPVPERYHKTNFEYRDDLRNMKAHGITPTLYEHPDSPAFESAIAIRKHEGIPIDPLYLTRLDVGLNPGWGAVDLVERELTYLRTLHKCAKFGIKQVFGYATDEAFGDDIPPQFPYWELARKHDIGIQATAFWGSSANNHIRDLWDQARNRIDTAILQQGNWWTAELPEIIQSWQDMGVDIWRYSSREHLKPATARYRFGLEAYRYGASGTCPYAYQAQGGPSIWMSRGCSYALPAKTGPINTRQMKGYETGIYDVRYAKPLESLGGICPVTGGDLYANREAMVGEIMRRMF